MGQETFGDRLRRLRERDPRELSIEKAAHLMGISFSALQAWETNKRMPKSLELMKLAQFYGQSLDYLMGTEQEKKSPEQEIKAFLRRQGLDDKDVETILTFLEAQHLRRARGENR